MTFKNIKHYFSLVIIIAVAFFASSCEENDSIDEKPDVSITSPSETLFFIENSTFISQILLKSDLN